MSDDKPSRRLAAILAADVAGYSRLMGADEEGTLAVLTAHRTELIEPCIARHDGRLVKTTGDGLLVEFASVVDAIRCAVAVQDGMAERNAGTPEDSRIVFRIGVNLGDIIVQDDDVFGDGVNVAARLEGLAEPGGVLISGLVRESIGNKLDLGFEDLGARDLKNIAEPVHVYRLLSDAGAAGRIVVAPATRLRRWKWPAAVIAVIVVAVMIAGHFEFFPIRSPGPESEPAAPDRIALALPDKPSIAVLPFDNLSGDAGQDYFSDGITEDIITELSRFQHFFVIARNSTFTYKGRPVKPQRVARELGVRYVLEGSVRRADAKVRVTAQLIDATTGGHLWAERYDRDLADVFAVQDEITQRIVAALAGKVSVAEAERATRKRTGNLDAYDHVLRGRELVFRFTRESSDAAKRMFEKAIALDPSYARAYANLSWSHLNDFRLGWGGDRRRSLERALGAARRAVSIDNTNALAHAALGDFYLWSKQYDGAVAAIEKALALNPNDADRLAQLGDLLAWVGEPERGISEIRKAMRLNPVNPMFYSWQLGHAYFVVGEYAKAVTLLENSRDRTPTFAPARVYLAASYAYLGRPEEARAEIGRAFETYKGWTASRIRENLPYKRASDLDRLMEGLHKAGLAE